MKILSIPAIACAMTLGFGLASAQTITPTRVGPVSQYGQLITGKNSAGKGRIYGSCQGVKDGAEVQVRGMSLYWSLKPEAVAFWSEAGVASMVNDMNIQLIRASMATGSEDWWGCKDMSSDCGESNHMTGYASDPTFQKNLMTTVVEAAIKNDIYVILDWHSHEAENQTESSKGFFSEMAQTYGSYNNVIFEVYNEPKGDWGEDAARSYWPTIKNYATTVISAIRQYSDNLILVGNPYYDQYPNVVVSNPISDDNVAYTFHYYACSHSSTNEGANAITVLNSGLPIFVSEWGTGNADGTGDYSNCTSANATWQSWLDNNKLSWANWSASKVGEGTAAFTSAATASSLQYTTSGNAVKGYLATNPTTYTACADAGTGGETVDPNALKANAVSKFNVTYADRVMNISGTQPASVDFFDMNGNKIMSLQNIIGSLSLKSFPVGQYIVRIHNASANMSRIISIK